jgi:hypothetical protein
MGRQIIEEHFTVADDGRQQVVQIVGDPAGQTADGLYLLSLTALIRNALRKTASLGGSSGWSPRL